MKNQQLIVIHEFVIVGGALAATQANIAAKAPHTRYHANTKKTWAYEESSGCYYIFDINPC